MARYKQLDTQPKLLPVDLSRQFLPGPFEHAVQHLLEHVIDLTPFDTRFRNDATGAPAYRMPMLAGFVRHRRSDLIVRKWSYAVMGQ